MDAVQHDFDDFCRADLALDIAEMRDTDDVQRRRDIYINVSAGQQCQESFVSRQTTHMYFNFRGSTQNTSHPTA